MKETLEQKLQRGVVMGDGGYLLELDRRGDADTSTAAQAARK
jgi:hypothetical protein